MNKIKILKFIDEYISFDRYRKLLQFLNHYVVGLFKRFDEDHIFLTGGGIAFSLILSTIPLLLLVFALLGNIIDPTTLDENIRKLINTIIPYPEYANYTTQVILKRIPGVFQYSASAFYLGLAGLFFTSTWLFSSMRTILNKIFGVPKDKSVLVGFIRDFGMVVLVIFLVFISTFLIPTVNIFIHATESIEILQKFKLTNFVNIIFSFGSVIVVLLLFFLFYSLIPYAKLNKKITFIGAFWATLLWQIARIAFGYYVQNYLSANKFYGAFLLILVLLFWLFYSSILFIIGAEIAELYRERLNKKNEIQKNNN